MGLASNHRCILLLNRKNLGCGTNFVTPSLKSSTPFEGLRANRIVSDTPYHGQRHLSSERPSSGRNVDMSQIASLFRGKHPEAGVSWGLLEHNSKTVQSPLFLHENLYQ